jgi:hypothetical protein
MAFEDGRNRDQRDDDDRTPASGEETTGIPYHLSRATGAAPDRRSDPRGHDDGVNRIALGGRNRHPRRPGAGVQVERPEGSEDERP